MWWSNGDWSNRLKMSQKSKLKYHCPFFFLGLKEPINPEYDKTISD